MSILGLTKLQVIKRLVDPKMNTLNVEDLVRYTNLILLRLNKLFEIVDSSDGRFDENAKQLAKLDIDSHVNILNTINISKVFEYGIEERKILMNLNNKSNFHDNLFSLLTNYCSLKASITKVDTNNNHKHINSIVSDELLAEVSCLYLYTENIIETLISINQSLNPKNNYLASVLEFVNEIENKSLIPEGLNIASIEKSYINFREQCLHQKSTNTYVTCLNEKDIDFLCELVRLNMKPNSSNKDIRAHNYKLLTIYEDILNNWELLIKKSSTNSNSNKTDFPVNNNNKSSLFKKNSSIFILLNKSKNENATNAIVKELCKNSANEVIDIDFINKIKNSHLNQTDYTMLALSYIEDGAISHAYEFYTTKLEGQLSKIKSQEKDLISLYNNATKQDIFKQAESKSVINPMVAEMHIEEKYKLYEELRKIAFDYLKKKTGFVKESFITETAELKLTLSNLVNSNINKISTKNNSKSKFEKVLEKMHSSTNKYISVLESDFLEKKKREALDKIKIIYYNNDMIGQVNLNYEIEAIFDKLKSANLLGKQGSPLSLGKKVSVNTINELENLEITQIEKEKILNSVYQAIKEVEAISNDEKSILEKEELIEFINLIGKVVDYTIPLNLDIINSKELSDEDNTYSKKAVEEFTSKKVNSNIEKLKIEVILALKNNDLTLLQHLISKVKLEIENYRPYHANLKSTKFKLFKNLSLPNFNSSQISKMFLSQKHTFFYLTRYLNLVAGKTIRPNFYNKRTFSIMNLFNKKGLSNMFFDKFNRKLSLNSQSKTSQYEEINELILESLAVNNLESNSQEIKEIFNQIDEELLKLCGISKENSILLAAINSTKRLENKDKLEKAKSILNAQIEYPDFNLVNTMMLYGIRNNKPSGKF